MRKILLMALAGGAIALAAPQIASALPAGLGNGISAAAEKVQSTEVVRHRRWHHRHHRHHRHHHRHWRRY